MEEFLVVLKLWPFWQSCPIFKVNSSLVTALCIEMLHCIKISYDVWKVLILVKVFTTQCVTKSVKISGNNNNTNFLLNSIKFKKAFILQFGSGEFSFHLEQNDIFFFSLPLSRIKILL